MFYEVSTAGDKRFSALVARLSDGRTIEEHYQCDVKGYPTWREGKGKPPINGKSFEELWEAYLGLWIRWSELNPDLIEELRRKSAGKLIVDQFARTRINQARALKTILRMTS